MNAETRRIYSSQTPVCFFTVRELYKCVREAEGKGVGAVGGVAAVEGNVWV
jgi:hypothetical protein